MSSISPCRKRPCCICRKWFQPDPRLGGRQKACSAADCQKRRRAKTQATWRRGNPGYFVARRIIERNDGEREAEPLRVPAPLSQLPWDLAQDEMGGKAADFVGVLGRLLLHHVQDLMRSYPRDFIAGSGRLPGTDEKTRAEPGEDARLDGAGADMPGAALREAAPA